MLRARKLTVLHDAVDVEDLPAAMRDHDILAWNADAWSALGAAGLRCLSPGDANHDAHEHAEAVACSAHRLWTDHARCWFGETDLLGLIACRHRNWLHRAAWVRIVTEYVLRDRSIECLMLPDRRIESRPHLLDLLPGESEMPALDLLAASAARHLGIDVVRVPLKPRTAVPRAATVARGLPLDAPELSPGHALLIVDTVDLTGYHCLRRAFLQQGAPPLVAVTHTEQCVRDGGDHDPVMHQDAYAGPLSEVRVPGAEQALDYLLRACAVDGSPGAALLVDDGLRPHLEFLYGPYARSVGTNLQRWSRAIHGRRPALVIASYPCMALEAAHLNGVRSLLLPHAALMTGLREYHAMIPSSVRLGATGLLHEKMLVRQGIPAERIVVTGCLRSPVGTAVPTYSAGETEQNVRLLVPVTGPVTPSRVSQLPVPGYWNEPALILELAEACASRGWHLEIRTHPAFGSGEQFYRRLFPKCAEMTVTGRGQQPLRDAVQRSFAVVCIGGPSSVIPEAASVGRPVFVVESSLPAGAVEAWGLEEFLVGRSIADVVRSVEHFAANEEERNRAGASTRRAAEGVLGSDSVAGERAILHLSGGDAGPPG